jgi:hypothetical protein
MTEPKLHVIGETPSGTSVFDDLDALRKTPTIKIARKSVVVNVDVGRPPSDCYFRAHPDPEWRLEDAAIVKAKDADTVYYISPYSGMASHPKLKDRVRKVTLAVIAVWPANTVRIWPVPVLGQSKTEFKPWKSSRAAFELSLRTWVQMSWSEEMRDYAIETAEGLVHEPVWPPEHTFRSLLKLAFDGKIIEDENHDFVRQLRGLTD